MTNRGRLAGRLACLIKRLDGARAIPDLSGLARDYGVSRRTILRDLAAMEEAHIELPPNYYELES